MYSIDSHLGSVRKACNVSLLKLSRATGLSEEYISDIEEGIVQPNLLDLLSLADALDVPLNCLVTVRNSLGFVVTQWWWY